MATWLTDPTANKYIQTYFKNFVEISGNFIVHDSQYVDISNNITLKNGAFLKFPDGTIQTTAGFNTTIPTDISFNNVDISNNLSIKGITTTGNIFLNGNIQFTDLTNQNTAYTPATTISVNNFVANGTVTLPSNSISNSALKSNVVITDSIQTLTNKTIFTNGITDVSNATFNNVVINGTFTLPASINTTNLTLTGLLTTENATVNTLLTTQNETVNNNITVKNLTSTNKLELLSPGIFILPTTGILQGAPISSTQLAYVVAISTPAVGDYISPSQYAAGITNVGSTGSLISAIDTTNKIVTFSPAFGSVPTALTTKQVYGYASSTSVIQTQGYKSVIVNDVCVPTTSAITPYVASLNATNKTITLQGACLTTVTGTTTTGVYDSLSRLISNSMPPLGTLFGSGATTSQIDTLITPKYATILGATNSPTTIAVTVTGYAYSPTQLNVVTTTSVAVNQFIRDSGLSSDFSKGTTVSAFSAVNNTITLSNGTVTSQGASGTVQGYSPSTTGVIITNNNTQFAVNNFVEGTGIPTVLNRISAYTASSYQFTLANTTTQSANTTFNGYIKSTNIIVESGTTLTVNNFLQGTGLTSGSAGYTRVSTLSSTNTYGLTGVGTPVPATAVAFTGVALSSTLFYYSTAVTPVVGEFIGHQAGARITAVNTTNGTVTSSGLIPATYTIARLGYIKDANTFQIEPTQNFTVSVGQFITGGGFNGVKPYITATDSFVKTLTISGTQTPTLTDTTTGIILYNGTTRFFVTTVPLPARTYFYGAFAPQLSVFVTTGTPGTSDTYHQYSTLFASSTQATAYITAKTVYPISATRIIYNAVAGSLFTNGSLLYTRTESNKFGAYITATGGTANDCELTIANSYIPALTPTLVNGRIYKSGTTNYLYYQYAPVVNGYAYNSNITTYNNGGFVIATAVGGYSRATMTYKNQTLVTNTPVVIAITGYVSSNGLLFLNITDAQRTTINALALGSIVEIVDGTAKNELKNAWFSSQIATGAYALTTLNSANADPAYVSSDIKTYTLVASSRAVSTKTIIYVQKTLSSVPLISVGDFVDFYAYPQYTTGATVATVTTYTDAIGTYYGVTFNHRSWVTTFIAPVDVAFSSGSTVNIYRNDSFQVYSPTVNNTDAFTPTSYSIIPEQTIYLYNPVSDFKYASSSYTSFTPTTYSIYQPQTFSLSAPLTITYFPTTLYSFYNGAQPTSFIQQRTLIVPQPNVNDTFALLNSAQTFTNKTLTTPVLTNPTVDTISLGTSTVQISSQLGYTNSFGMTPGTITSANTSGSPKLMSTFTLPAIGIYIVSYNIFGAITTNGLVVTAILKYNSAEKCSTACYGISGFNISTGSSVVIAVTSTSHSITLDAWGAGSGTLTISNPSTPSSYVQYTRIA